MEQVTRRDFVKTAAAATVFLGTSRNAWAGANDRVRVAQMGLNGRGQSHLKGYVGLENVEVATLCDPDSRLFAPRTKTFFTDLGKPAPKVEQDIRGSSTTRPSTPSRSPRPTTGTPWRRSGPARPARTSTSRSPAAHNIFEGRKMVEAAGKYNRIVQHGTQPAQPRGIREGIEKLHEGVIGEVYMARGLCFKWRPSHRHSATRTARPGVDYDLWLGPAEEPLLSTQNRFHYNWHWLWDYGNGDIGNQGVHQMDVARWGLGVGLPYARDGRRRPAALGRCQARSSTCRRRPSCSTARTARTR